MVIQIGQKDSLERKEGEIAQMCSGDQHANKRKHLVFAKRSENSPPHG